jgi:hypothetical protein
VPELKLLPVRKGSNALVVGNGPSNATCPWPAIRNGLRRVGFPHDDLFLINGSALGRTVPEYAAAVDMDIVQSFVRNGLHDVATILTGHQEKVCGPERWERSIGDAAGSPGFVHGPESWPPLASGPLCVWAASVLGYETIAIYGLDGSLSPPPEHDPQFGEKVAVWESWLLRWREARARMGERPGAGERAGQRLLRVWPAGQGVPLATDPLRACLDGTLLVSPA